MSVQSALEQNQRDQQLRLEQIASGVSMHVMIQLRQQALSPQDAAEIHRRWFLLQICATTSRADFDILTRDATPELRAEAFEYHRSFSKVLSGSSRSQAQQSSLRAVPPQQSLTPASQLNLADETAADGEEERISAEWWALLDGTHTDDVEFE